MQFIRPTGFSISDVDGVTGIYIDMKSPSGQAFNTYMSEHELKNITRCLEIFSDRHLTQIDDDSFHSEGEI